MNAVNIFTKSALTIAVLAVIGTIVFLLNDNRDNGQKIATLNNDKSILIKSLKKIKDSLEIVISLEKKAKTDLIIQRQKTENLIIEISELNLEAFNKANYQTKLKNLKTEITNLKREIQFLALENNDLKQKNEYLATKSDLEEKNNDEIEKHNEALASINNNLANKLKENKQLSVINFKAITFKQSDSGELEKVEKARKANLLRINFGVVGSNVSKAVPKEYYIQIFDENENLIGNRKTFKLNSKTVEYSFLCTFKYKDSYVEVLEDFEMHTPVKGTYVVNLYDKSKMVSNTNFRLN